MKPPAEQLMIYAAVDADSHAMWSRLTGARITERANTQVTLTGTAWNGRAFAQHHDLE